MLTLASILAETLEEQKWLDSKQSHKPLTGL